jgi:hypothetical protein
MHNYRLRNVSVYQAENSIYIANGDHSLVEISGKSVNAVVSVLSALEITSSPEILYEKVKSELGGDRAIFDQIIDWLLTNKIIERTRDGEAPIKRVVRTYIHSTHLTEDQKEKVVERLSGERYGYVRTEKGQAEFILIVSPIFDQMSEIMKINEFAYEENIPLCHVGIDAETFTIGPISHAKLNTPCLKCYSQRKISNLKNPKKTIEFVRYANKKQLSSARIAENPYFYNVLLTHLKVELEKFFQTNGLFSAIVGKSLMFDHFNYEITKSKILKVPGCPVCNSEVLVAPLNG